MPVPTGPRPGLRPRHRRAEIAATHRGQRRRSTAAGSTQGKQAEHCEGECEVRWPGDWRWSRPAGRGREGEPTPSAAYDAWRCYEPNVSELTLSLNGPVRFVGQIMRSDARSTRSVSFVRVIPRSAIPVVTPTDVSVPVDLVLYRGHHLPGLLGAAKAHRHRRGHNYRSHPFPHRRFLHREDSIVSVCVSVTVVPAASDRIEQSGRWIVTPEGLRENQERSACVGGDSRREPPPLLTCSRRSTR